MGRVWRSTFFIETSSPPSRTAWLTLSQLHFPLACAWDNEFRVAAIVYCNLYILNFRLSPKRGPFFILLVLRMTGICDLGVEGGTAAIRELCCECLCSHISLKKFYYTVRPDIQTHIYHCLRDLNTHTHARTRSNGCLLGEMLFFPTMKIRANLIKSHIWKQAVCYVCNFVLINKHQVN